MNAVVTDNRYDRVKLNYISHKSSQSGYSGGREINIIASRRNHGGGGGGAGLRDEPTANDSSKKAHLQTEVNHSH